MRAVARLGAGAAPIPLQRERDGRRAHLRSAFSLLEVLLAMGVLAGCLVVLGHLATLGRRHANAARDLADAQRICQTRLNEILIGQAPLRPTEDRPLDDEPGWRCAVEVEPAEAPGIAVVRVTVTQDVPEGRPAKRFSLVRWVRDPLPESAVEKSGLPMPPGFRGVGR